MNKKITLSLLSAITLAGYQEVNAETVYVPYLPQKAELSQTITPEEYSEFLPSSAYSLQFTATAGSKIKYCNTSLNGFIYQPSESGTYRFAVNGSLIKVYKDNRFVEDIEITSLNEGDDVYGKLIKDADGESYWSVSDDVDAKSGIYNSKNLLLNPGFEEIDQWLEGSETRYLPTHWSAKVATPQVDENGDPVLDSEGNPVYDYSYDFNSGNSRVNTGTDLNSNIKNYEGAGVALWHGYGVEAFFQRIDAGKLKSNTTYQVQLASWTHGDTQGNGKYSVKIGTDVDVDDIASFTWTQTTTNWGLNNVSFVFKTGDINGDATTYFSVRRNSLSIAHFDRMTLVEFDDSSSEFGLSGSGISNVTFEDGKAYSPVITLKDGEKFEMTNMISNPNVDSNAGWQGTTSTNTGKHYSVKLYDEGTPEYEAAVANRYLDVYSSSILTFDSYQTIEELLDGNYTLECVARTNSDNFVIYAQGLKEFTLPITNNGNGEDEDNQGVSELGLGWNRFTLDIIVKDGTLKFGTKGTALDNGCWCSSDEYRLYYNGPSEDSEVIQALKDKLRSYAEYAITLDLDGMSDAAAEGVDQAYMEAMIEVRSTTSTEESVNKAYNNLVAAVNYALEIGSHYSNLLNLIDDLQVLDKPLVKTWIDLAYEVLDEDATAQDLIKAKNLLWSRVINYYKGYESIDDTGEILNPTIESTGDNDAVDGWVINKGNGNTLTTTGNHWSFPEDAEAADYEEEVSNRYLDSWNGTNGSMIYKAEQIVIGVPSGVYVIKAAVRTNGEGVYLYANNSETELPNSNNSGNELGRGWGYVEVPCIVGDDNSITFGIKTTTGWTGTWLSADDFSLTYYPGDVPLLGIESLDKDEVTVYSVDGTIKVIGGTAKTVYNVSGISLPVDSKLPTGIYFVIVNNKTYPVVVR